MEAKAKVDVEYLGRQVDAGQVVAVDDSKDEMYQRMGIFSKQHAEARRYACSRCGAEFTSTRARDDHGRRRHG